MNRVFLKGRRQRDGKCSHCSYEVAAGRICSVGDLNKETKTHRQDSEAEKLKEIRHLLRSPGAQSRMQ